MTTMTRWRVLPAAALALLLAAACGFVGPDTQPADEPWRVVARLADSRLREISGLAASRRYPGRYYVHNDSGDGPRVYVIDRSGRTVATITLTGVSAVDWEDIAIAPGTTSGTLDVCVADIGDNNNRRSNVLIHRFAEPELSTDGPHVALDITPTTYRLTYAEGPQNCEAFAVDPTNGDGYFFTKRDDQQPRVYRWPAPWNAAEQATLPLLRTLKLPPGVALANMVTAADMSPNGRRVALRCYIGGWEWTRAAGEAWSDALARAARPLPLPIEPQGEALAYAADGAALLTTSEGRNPPLHEVPHPDAE